MDSVRLKAALRLLSISEQCHRRSTYSSRVKATQDSIMGISSRNITTPMRRSWQEIILFSLLTKVSTRLLAQKDHAKRGEGF